MGVTNASTLFQQGLGCDSPKTRTELSHTQQRLAPSRVSHLTSKSVTDPKGDMYSCKQNYLDVCFETYDHKAYATWLSTVKR
jgi:hypothetical protein